MSVNGEEQPQQQAPADVWTELFVTVAQLGEAVDLSLQAFTPDDKVRSREVRAV